MNNKILLNSGKSIFKTHTRSDRGHPFVHHMYVTCGPCVSNFHENMELLYFLYGSGYVLYEGVKHPVCQGDLIVVNSYSVHQVVSEEPLKYFCLIIDNSFCRYHDIDVGAIHFTERIRDEKLASLLKRLMGECGVQRPFISTEVKLTLLEILLLLCRNYSGPKTVQAPMDASAQKRIRSAIRYIKKNINKKLTVAEVAAVAGLSQYYFMREFKKLTGWTLTNYINFLRCEYARELLQTGKYKVKEVAFLCGYESESYFINVFKQYTQTLPSEHLSTGSADN